MSLPNGQLPPAPEPNFTREPAAAPRGHPWLAWLVIGVVAAGFIVAQNSASQATAEVRASANLVLLEIMIRVQVGGSQALATEEGLDAKNRQQARDRITETVAALNRSSVEQRLRVIMTLGELDGPGRASDELTGLEALMKEQERTPSADEARWLDVLDRLYDDYVAGRPTAPTVSPDERRDLRTHFGWFGELALHPAGEGEDPERQRVLEAALRSFRTMLRIALFICLGLLVGVVGLILLALRARRGQLASRLGPAVPHHGIYAETFAVWLVVFLGLHWVGPHALPGVPTWAASALPMLLSLSALAWPTLRGIPWRHVRADIGLTLGRQPLLEPSYGILTYFLSLPFLLVGLLITFLLMGRVMAPASAPGDPFAPDFSLAHPIIERFARGSIEDWLPLFVLACVVAPIVEEIVFRGVLYRHLRDATGVLGRGFASIAVAALVVNVLFAAVHPQGVLAIPALASLACGFVLAREWRGTILPAVIAHAINNTLVLAALLGMSH